MKRSKKVAKQPVVKPLAVAGNKANSKGGKKKSPLSPVWTTLKIALVPLAFLIVIAGIGKLNMGNFLIAMVPIFLTIIGLSLVYCLIKRYVKNGKALLAAQIGLSVLGVGLVFGDDIVQYARFRYACHMHTFITVYDEDAYSAYKKTRVPVKQMSGKDFIALPMQDDLFRNTRVIINPVYKADEKGKPRYVLFRGQKEMNGLYPDWVMKAYYEELVDVSAKRIIYKADDCVVRKGWIVAMFGMPENTAYACASKKYGNLSDEKYIEMPETMHRVHVYRPIEMFKKAPPKKAVVKKSATSAPAGKKKVRK